MCHYHALVLIGVLVNTMLIAVNLMYSLEAVWFFYSLIGWGIGTLTHYLFGVRWLEGELEEKTANKSEIKDFPRLPSATNEIEVINMDKLQFREFNIKDTSKCSELVIDAWPSASSMVPKEDEIKFASIFIDLSRLSSTWLEVACISGNVIGFLFGRINSDYGMKDKFKAFFSTLAIFIKIIVGGYGRISKRFTFLKKAISTEIKVMQNRPKSDGEVTAFIVHSKYRGKGIGRMLMNRFIDIAKSKNAKVITVYTSQAANWKFYEIYGFRRYSTFYDDIASYVENKDIESFIYVINLQ